MIISHVTIAMESSRKVNVKSTIKYDMETVSLNSYWLRTIIIYSEKQLKDIKILMTL